MRLGASQVPGHSHILALRLGHTFLPCHLPFTHLIRVLSRSFKSEAFFFQKRIQIYQYKSARVPQAPRVPGATRLPTGRPLLDLACIQSLTYANYSPCRVPFRCHLFQKALPPWLGQGLPGHTGTPDLPSSPWANAIHV